MLSNSSLQPWFDYGNAINHASLVNNLFAALPPIQPCYGGSIGGEAVNCSVVCEYPYLLFDPQHPSNLVTCGLWATLTAGFERSGSYPNATPFDAVGLNISATESIGGEVCSFSGHNLPFRDHVTVCETCSRSKRLSVPLRAVSLLGILPQKSRKAMLTLDF